VVAGVPLVEKNSAGSGGFDPHLQQLMQQQQQHKTSGHKQTTVIWQ
jgi:hypothetical protein